MSSYIYNKVWRIGSLLSSLFVLLPFASCVDFNDGVTEALDVNVQLVLPEGIAAGDLSGHVVTMVSTSGASTSAKTNASGIATFSNVIPANYTFSTSWTLTREEYASLTGDDEVNQGAVMAGNLANQLLTHDQTLAMTLKLSIQRSIVIGKIYFAGSKDNNGRNYDAGKYIEIYNQSDDSVDVAGLYLGLTESNSKPAYTLEEMAQLHPDSLMLKQIFQIPSDAPYYLAPGETLLLANSATDHTANDSLEHDLSGADFEAKDMQGKVLNNADVPALNLIYTAFSTLTYMNLLNSGLNGIVIFRTDEDVTELPRYYNYGKTSGSQWICMPTAWVIDGVETLPRKSTGEVDITQKRLPDDLDAGYSNIVAPSGRNAEVVYRKTSTAVGSDGHKVLEDTNNSTNDFQTSTTILPRQYD